uniref:Uncharacterized protein n=1 Tax=Physcomitrium patens TaxID=3218 RepID=A0A7I4B7F6_PHYPA
MMGLGAFILVKQRNQQQSMDSKVMKVVFLLLTTPHSKFNLRASVCMQSTALMTQGEHDKFHIGIGDEPSHAATAVSHKDEEHVKNGSRQRNSFSVANGERITRENGTEHGHEIAPSQMNMKEIAIKVAKKMLRLPLTYATVMGIVYSLIAGRYSIPKSCFYLMQ